MGVREVTTEGSKAATSLGIYEESEPAALPRWPANKAARGGGSKPHGFFLLGVEAPLEPALGPT